MLVGGGVHAQRRTYTRRQRRWSGRTSIHKGNVIEIEDRLAAGCVVEPSNAVNGTRRIVDQRHVHLRPGIGLRSDVLLNSDPALQDDLYNDLLSACRTTVDPEAQRVLGVHIQVCVVVANLQPTPASGVGNGDRGAASVGWATVGIIRRDTAPRPILPAGGQRIGVYH